MLFRTGGGIKYSEDNPRCEGMFHAEADNITWVGGYGQFCELSLKKEDTKVKIVFYNNLPYSRGINSITIKTEESVIETINLDKGSVTEKTYDLSKNTKIYFGLDNFPTSGSYEINMSYKVW